ncbi:hypothetical protein ACH4KN_06530 [Streptomyces sp. NPDC017546]|uniref:hypothetical protein n=1 Tax=unclassified Streptomyces TaxID=2593676 RepID=UPI00235FB6F8|nr:hypothetical protein [Streptomyces sp. MMBL 11-1]
MAWDEWEQLKADAVQRHATGMQLNQLGPGEGGSTALPGQTGDLKVGNGDLVKIGSQAHGLYNKLWDKARVAVPSSDKAAGDLRRQGFALGGGLQHGKAKDDAGPVMGELWESGVEKNSEYTEQAVEAAAKAHGRDDLMDNSIDEKARRSTQDGFLAAGTSTKQLNPHLKTDI